MILVFQKVEEMKRMSVFILCAWELDTEYL